MDLGMLVKKKKKGKQKMRKSNCYLGFLQDLAALVKAGSTEPCLNGSVFRSNLVLLHLNMLQGYHPVSVFSESLEAFLGF